MKEVVRKGALSVLLVPPLAFRFDFQRRTRRQGGTVWLTECLTTTSFTICLPRNQALAFSDDASCSKVLELLGNRPQVIRKEIQGYSGTHGGIANDRVQSDQALA